MAVELYLLDRLKARIQVARQIDSARHKIKKENHEKNWLREAAEAMEIEIDSDLGLRYIFYLQYFHSGHRIISSGFHLIFLLFHSSDEDSKNSIPLKHQRKQTNAKTASLQAELKALLSQPLVARGVSTRYITSGSRSIVDDVIAGECTWHHSLFLVSPIPFPLSLLARDDDSANHPRNLD